MPELGAADLLLWKIGNEDFCGSAGGLLQIPLQKQQNRCKSLFSFAGISLHVG